MARLTAKTVENLKAADTRREIPDQGCTGLYAIIQPSGRKGWAVRYRFGGKTRKLTLRPTLTLGEAREVAKKALREVEQGKDPATLKFEAQAAQEKATADRARDTIDALAPQFVERHAKKHTRPNSWRQALHVFNHIVLPAWRGRSIHDIRRRDIIELVEGVAERHPVMGNRALAHLSKFFNWCLEREVITASPCAGIKPPAKEQARERVLDDDEIKRLWLGCEAIGGPTSLCMQLLLLTGQRREEIARLKWSEVKGDTLELPMPRMKGKQTHLVPLSRQAAAIIASLPQIGDYLFGTSPVSHFSRIKRELDEHMGETPPWVIHDLRRTAASQMAKLGVSVPVIEKVIGHRSGVFRGIVGVYQKYDFAAEKRAALQRWAEHIDTLVTGRQAKVVTLRR
jgi:integrase